MQTYARTIASSSFNGNHRFSPAICWLRSASKRPRSYSYSGGQQHAGPGRKCRSSIWWSVWRILTVRHGLKWSKPAPKRILAQGWPKAFCFAFDLPWGSAISASLVFLFPWVCSRWIFHLSNSAVPKRWPDIAKFHWISPGWATCASA